jgi:diguanylate cyclase (GGDEF)-like protein
MALAPTSGFRTDPAAEWALPLTVGTPSLLLVDDNGSSTQLLAGMLASLGRVRLAPSGNDALRLAQGAPPDVVLVNAEMRAMNGLEFCARMKADPILAGVPVILVTSHRDVATEVAGFAVGAADFIQKPPVTEVVQARVRMQLRLKEMADALRGAELVDPLTGIANRRRFDEDLKGECLRARRSGHTLSLLMIDIDHFKRYNDRYGEREGDDCLRRVAAVLQFAVHRPADRLARYGGEEFVLLLPETDVEGASHVGRYIVDAISALQIPHQDSQPGAILTVSVGVAAARRRFDDRDDLLSDTALLSAADHALYDAKTAGRARCSVSTAAAPERAP